MEVALDSSFDEQRKRYSFCFTCEHCVHFDSDLEVCLHGFPNDMHRLSYYEQTPRPLTILFCKDFDLV